TPETEPILAFTPEGPVFLSENDLAISLLWEEGEPLSVHHLNKRLNNVGGIFLYTADFVDEEGFSLPNAWAARLKVEEGELRLGTSLTLTVAEVLDKPEDKVLLAEDELLLASNTPYFASAISHFTLGETVTLALTASDERLLSATTATGCGDLLVADGEITDPESWDKELLKTHPRTVFGLMEDGTMVFTVLDGRTAGHSVGATLAELAADLKSKGCRWAVNLDGGGSTAMAVRLPGDARAEVVNTPSIGKLRSCGTYLLFVTEAEPTPAGLYLEGDGDYLLTGSSYPLTWLAYKSSLSALSPPEDVKASCTAYGTVEETVYTAGAEPGEETITLSSESTGLVGTGTLFLVDTVDELRLVNLLTGREAVFSELQEGSELLLRPVLRLNGRPVR
ncbi:MAG: phosphodiester glycosidase family protein, partial [bacterium]